MSVKKDNELHLAEFFLKIYKSVSLEILPYL
jgi:hypothetical protein